MDARQTSILPQKSMEKHSSALFPLRLIPDRCVNACCHLLISGTEKRKLDSLISTFIYFAYEKVSQKKRKIIREMRQLNLEM